MKRSLLMTVLVRIHLVVGLWMPLFGSDQAVFFEKKIRPVLVEHCYKCHSLESGKEKGGLLLDSKEAMLRGGDSGPAIVPNEVEKSLLIEAIRYTNVDLQMPEKKQLSKEIVADFEVWVQTGAFDPRVGQKNVDKKVVLNERMQDGRRDHWSYQPMINYRVPETKNKRWGHNEYDSFILAKLEEHDLQPALKANPESLLRRLSLDLVGLPPSLEKLEAFRIDPSLQNYQEIVDDYLASPQFGIKWSRFWLDLARYSETAGGGRSYPIPSAWRYRNYVIDAFNQDMPYNQFLREQIAGDLLSFDNSEQQSRQLTATGFMVLGAKPLDQADKEQLLYDHIDEQLDTLGKVTMAMTFGCARCHDHRFDPVTERDYYRMAAIFANSNGLQNMLISRLNDQALPGATAETSEKAKQNTEEFRKILGDLAAISVGIQSGKKGLDEKKRKLELNFSQLLQQDSEMKKVLALSDKSKMEPGYIRVRGQASRIGASVDRGGPLELINNLLPESVPENQSGRLQLAEWIVSPKHPLTARVMVNRVWAQLFESGLVVSLDNFGMTGEKPSHAELLDYMALDFMRNNWSFKKLVKKIVLSASYQMSTVQDKAMLSKSSLIDPGNRYLSYYPLRRMKAEALRDSILTISGDLDDREVEGILPYSELQSSRNRSVFLPTLREEGRNHLLDVFDFPDAAASMGKRNSTNLPSQALYLLNSPFIQEQAGKTAQRIIKETEGKSNAERLNLLSQLIYARPLLSKELILYQAHLQQMPEKQTAWTMVVHTMLCSVDFRFLNEVR